MKVAKPIIFSSPPSNQEDPLASLSKGFGSALSFGSSFVQKAASFTKDNAVKIGSAAAHAGGEISKKAQDGSLAGQGSAVLGSAFGELFATEEIWFKLTLGTLSSWGKTGLSAVGKVTSDGLNVINQELVSYLHVS